MEKRAKEMAERGGFDPPANCSAAVFKTAAINHSTISPSGSIKEQQSRIAEIDEECGKGILANL